MDAATRPVPTTDRTRPRSNSRQATVVIISASVALLVVVVVLLSMLTPPAPIDMAPFRW